MTQPVRHFVDLWKIEASDLRAILDDAKARKAARRGWTQGRLDADAPARERTLAMIFQKNSTRTRFSFDAAMRQLGGDVIISTANDMQLGRGETIEDTAKVLSRMVDAIMLRANSHDDVERLAYASTVPVINGLSDKGHPCQIIADLMTFEEHRGPLAGRTIAWVGDGNNVCSSFIHAAPKLGFKLNIASPALYHPDLMDLARAADLQGQVFTTDDPREAVRGADCVITDTWVSMGDTDHDERMEALEPYQVDGDLMSLAAKDGVFLHCLPAHRGEEVTDDVIDGPQSLIWDEAENRIHAQKSILAWCFGAI
ncbi:ornithine carbamoyltransferase [Phenylobacterium sp. Root77]|jgi:ornithine carbamoyltransferase|uniref:ornithine carbamoyltransferase n=1 Tax=unclassified Phenylobacterium TaxID=2640670 RepID=UPI0006FCF56E|nr:MULTISPECIES: ornithine carbamoyltransferase [unclassified Phenylobacterium]KQW73196.1 ornithine carbamoyltransferase [Phenylobacterium sp. Root1277]KQW92416.1 ornithine carbamoyltransferase [Phenylobacterium sp. Root1290]KRC40645.1 ornithine carbamoyltransferase [Phenylobacterium sp. Root77]